MVNNLHPNNEISEFILFKSANGEIRVEVFLHNENVWLTQKRMADLFGVGIPAISKHLENIFNEGELLKESYIIKMNNKETNILKYQKQYELMII